MIFLLLLLLFIISLLSVKTHKILHVVIVHVFQPSNGTKTIQYQA